MGFVFDPPPPPAIAIADSADLFPVRRVYCVGRNYAAHAREMGKDPTREPPFFFSKPADAIVGDGVAVPYPPETDELHYEGELVVAIGKAGRDIAVENALDHVWGYAIGNDLTRRDMQAVAKKMGRPWDLAKGFDNSVVVGPVHPVTSVGHITRGRISSRVNDDLRQNADLSEMIWPVPNVISILSGLIELRAGDLIMTGTPAGVGKLVPEDICVVEIEGLGQLTTPID